MLCQRGGVDGVDVAVPVVVERAEADGAVRDIAIEIAGRFAERAAGLG